MNKNPELRRQLLMQQAENILREEKLLSLPVDLEALAATRNIEIRSMPSHHEGVSGMLARHGNTFGILYATHIDNEGYQRFSIAHEFGHYFAEGHLDHISFEGGLHSSRAGFVSDDPYEREADYFASGLLMPLSLIRSLVRHKMEGLPSIEAIQVEANVSLTAAAIRYATFTADSVAVVVSRNGVIDYCFQSDTLKNLKGTTWLKKGSPIPHGTATARLTAKPEDIQHGKRDFEDGEFMDWFGGTKAIPMNEDVIGLGGYDRILTVLTCPTVEDESYSDDLDDSDEALEESWTPRFKK